MKFKGNPRPGDVWCIGNHGRTDGFDFLVLTVTHWVYVQYLDHSGFGQFRPDRWGTANMTLIKRGTWAWDNFYKSI